MLDAIKTSKDSGNEDEYDNVATDEEVDISKYTLTNFFRGTG